MPFSVRPLMLLRLVAALMVAVVGIQSLPTGAIPLERGKGSAFSAGTLDVATTVLSARSGDAKLIAKARPEPPAVPVPVAIVAQDTVSVALWRESGGSPRAPPHLVLVASPRAPPAA